MDGLSSTFKPIFHCEAKYLASGVGVGQCPRRQVFCVGDTNMLVSCRERNPTQNLIFAFYPKRNPNASQWNIGCVGSLALGLCIGHVHFIFFVLISFALGSRRKRSFQWNMGLSVSLNDLLCLLICTNLQNILMIHSL